MRLNVGEDHKSSGANVPFTARPPLISDPIQGRPLGERPRGAAINKRDEVTAALRSHGGRRVFSQGERGDDKGGGLEP